MFRPTLSSLTHKLNSNIMNVSKNTEKRLQQEYEGLERALKPQNFHGKSLLRIERCYFCKKE